jgi:excisionase family DNA binding protein
MNAKPELPEKFSTLKEAAALLGVPYWKLQRAVKYGLIPSYKLLNSRPLVLPSEVIAAIKKT